MKRLKTEVYDVDGSNVKITRSSGNVFADLGLDNSEELLIKANFAVAIRKAISALKLTQKDAALKMNLDQPKVSQLVNGRIDGYTTDRLIRLLNDLGCDVTINISQPEKDKSRGNVIFE